MNTHDDILSCIGNTPLVRLRNVVPATAPVPVFAKCEHLNPGGSLKDRIALAIIDDAEHRGLIRPGDTLVEGTGGNTGLGLAMVAAVRGYRLVCVLPQKMSHDKRTALRLMGAEVIITDDAPADDPRNFRNVAAQLAVQHGWFLTDQFNNPANVQIHHDTTADEIFRQTRGTVAAFVAGVGTGGTLTGVGRRLKQLKPEVLIVLADPVGSRLARYVTHGELGEEGKYQLEGMGGSSVPRNFDRQVVDTAETVADQDAFAMTLRLIREEGLLVGGSSGACVVAALRVAAGLDKGVVVTVLGDSWDRYWSKPWLAESAQAAATADVQPAARQD